MASAKASTAAKGPQQNNGGAQEEFDWSSFVPAGYDASKFIEIGGLTPIYIPEQALANNFPPVFGWIDRVEYLPTQREGKDDEWTPACLRVVVEKATKAVAGTKEDRKIVDIQEGEDVLVPLTGNLRSNEKLKHMATDLDNMHVLGFRVRGTKDIGRPSEMYDWETRATGVSKPRTGRFAFPHTHLALDPKKALTASGVPYDAATGEVKEKAAAARS